MPRIVSNMQVVSPRKGQNTVKDKKEETWATVVGRRRGRNRSEKRTAVPSTSRDRGGYNSNVKNTTARKKDPIKRRSRRTAAVVIKNMSTERTYAEILREARTRVSLRELG